jgi:hypothetical protein
MSKVSRGPAWLALLATVLAVTIGSLFPATERAEAATCLPTHCYGDAAWVSTPTFDGGLAYINTGQLYVGDQCTELVTSEIWVGTAYDANFGHYVEEGATHGVHANGACGSGYQWFWASTLGGAYAEHYPSGFPVSLNTPYVTKVQYQGTGSQAYGAYRNGTLAGYVGTACCTKVLEVGGETSTTAVQELAEASALQKELSDGTWTYDWGGATLHQTGPMYSAWITTSKDLTYGAP